MTMIANDVDTTDGIDHHRHYKLTETKPQLKIQISIDKIEKTSNSSCRHPYPPRPCLIATDEELGGAPSEGVDVASSSFPSIKNRVYQTSTTLKSTMR